MRRAIVLTVALLLVGGMAAGQRGLPLDRMLALPGVHKHLIGQNHCIKCHGDTQRPSKTKCLSCHAEIQVRLDRGDGYHYNMVVREQRLCEGCHREHQGDLEKLAVWADTTAMQAFDHNSTGHTLEGAHAKLRCRQCHQPNLSLPGITQRARVEESFLGMPQACAGCHTDIHAGKFDTDCAKCHYQENWRELIPDAPFDHSKTDFALQGLHGCIPAHTGRDLCLKCHKSGRYTEPLPFGTCKDCHADKHQGQLADRADGGRCEVCHEVSGFSRVLYTIDAHRESRFPLEGSHRAVPCNSCHKKDLINGVETVRLEFASFECAGCHRDPPTGHIDEIAERFTCSACHAPVKWTEVKFDHAQTKFPLTGRHTEVGCPQCHQKENLTTPLERVRYVKMISDSTNCEACHTEAHQNQFVGKKCVDCHTLEELKPTLFDHARDASFALEGKHKEAKCRDCHRLEVGPDGQEFRRFKPMSTECRACHDLDGSVKRYVASKLGRWTP